MRELKSAVTGYFSALPPETAVNMIEYSGKIRTAALIFQGRRELSPPWRAFKPEMGSVF